MSTISKIEKLVTKLTKINDNCVFFKMGIDTADLTESAKVRYEISVFQNDEKDGVNQYDFETLTQSIEFLELKIKEGLK